MFCTTCGTKLPLNAAFCPGCGTKIEVPSQTPEWAKPREVSAEPDAQAMPTPTVGAWDRAAQAGNEGAVRKETALGATRKPRPSIVRIIVLVALFGLLSFILYEILVLRMGDSISMETCEPPVENAEIGGEWRVIKAQAMARVIESGIETYYAMHGEWPTKIESYANSGNPPSGNPGALPNSDADAVVQQVVKEADNNNPLLDPSMLLVATKKVADGTKLGYGMNFCDARRRGVPLSDMAFGYQRKKDGMFCRFVIKYNPTNNTVTVSHPDLFK